MRSLKFLTWLDVKRLIRQKTLNGCNLPDPISSILCFSDALEIVIPNIDSKGIVQDILADWFKDWYQRDQNVIRLDIGDSTLPIEFFEGESTHPNSPSRIRPFWQEIAYLGSSDSSLILGNLSSKIRFPETSFSSPKIIAFYSFKGGVGRTLHLASYLFALLDASKERGKKLTILVVDADLEAPGLTYWNRTEKQQSTISFIDFLEAYHYTRIDRQETLDLLAEEIKKAPKHEGLSTFYFLPACLNDEQLLDTPVLPEHLARSLESEWSCGDAFHQLGKTLSVDYVLVDLRAGLSEISSPIIFDPRIQRFFVTSATEQSTAGTKLVLEQISRIAPSSVDSSSGKFYDPSVIISFLTPELRKLPAFENSLEKFNSAYNISDQSDDEHLYPGRLEIKETDFSQELLYVNSWEEAKNKLSSTSMMKVAKEWATSQLNEDFDLVNQTGVEQNTSNGLETVRSFRDKCKQYEFAESGVGEGLLVTESLKNLANTFRNDLPRVVSIGAKGSGKTFTYMQLSRLKYWETFLKVVLKDLAEVKNITHIFPLLQADTLKDDAEKIVREARDATKLAFSNSILDFLHSDFQNSIKSFLEGDSSESEIGWINFWVCELSKSVGFNQEKESASLSSLDNYLKQNNVRLVFLFDGLENVFLEAATSRSQQTALRTLISLPKRMNEIRQANFGLIILLRRDFLRYSVTQNLAQFENLYRSYDLSWDFLSFLKLVYWVCSQASVISANEETLDTLSQEELGSSLKSLWGTKFGGDNSKEAYVANWIYAELSDFKGRLQARDIIRLLYHAANITVENNREIQFDRWSSSRLLPPQAIRRAIDPCSNDKVKEIKEEYPEFRYWVEEVVVNYTSKQKQVPFTLDTLSLEQTVLRMLEDIGVIYEDRGRDDILRYYMPEIYRSGLGFTLEKGARPRVLVLKRKALGTDVL